MVATYAQKMAVRRYAEKKHKRGERSRSMFATDDQWKIILPLSKFIKQIKIENLSNVCIDDERGVITFEVKEGTKLIDTDGNNTSDDTTQRSE